MFNLKNYKNEINAIAIANDMPWDVGKDMFVANIQNAGGEGAPYYAGADKVDYKALKVEWNKLSIDEKGKAKNEYDAWYRSQI